VLVFELIPLFVLIVCVFAAVGLFYLDRTSRKEP
jgi:hypothetical protein